MFTYILALAFIAVLLFSFVRLHIFFGLHRGVKTKVSFVRPHVERPLDLHDHIFRKA